MGPEEASQDARLPPLSALAADGTHHLLANILQRLDHGVLLQGPDAEILLANQAALDLLGVTEDQLLGRTSYDPGWQVARGDGSPFPLSELPVPMAIRTRAPVHDILVGVDRPRLHDRVWLNVSAVPELDDRGRVRNVVCSLVDVTERRRVQQELRREHELVQQVMATSVAGIIVLEPSGQIIYANPSAEQILGLTKTEIESLSYDAPEWKSTALDGGPWPDENQPFVRVLTTRAPVYNVRHCIEWPNGNRKALTVNGAPVFGANGEIERLVFAILDITDLLRAEEDQRQIDVQMDHLARQDSLSILAGGIAHDFNNLLVGVLTAADLARDEIPAGHRAEAHLKLVIQTAQRAAELTRQLLAYSGQGQFMVRRIDLTAAAREVIELAGVVSREIDLQVALQDELPSIQADLVQVKQILMNLLLNAADATRELHGRVSLRTGIVNIGADALRKVNTAGERLEPGLFVYADVEDTGTGMDAATVQRIFDPFFTTKEKGHGLGLAAVLGVLRGHGGFIQVESAPGVGTRFRVAFPAVGAPADSAPARTPLPQLEVGFPGAVLVIDDEPMVRTVAQRVLQKHGVRVLTAQSGPEGLDLFDQHRDDLCAVVLDLTMPGMSGDEVLSQLRAVAPELPILIMSGYTQREADRAGGRTRFIAKPFRAKALLDSLRDLVFGE